jgi:predicted alpha/beta-hydrolase family hydrolase
MTSQAQAEAPLPRVAGIAFFGFPLHAAGRPADARGRHLADVRVPMLFLQGTRDALADVDLVEALVAGLGTRATLHRVDGADHSFRVPKRSGRSEAQVLDELLDAFSAWLDAIA